MGGSCGFSCKFLLLVAALLFSPRHVFLPDRISLFYYYLYFFFTGLLEKTSYLIFFSVAFVWHDYRIPSIVEVDRGSAVAPAAWSYKLLLSLCASPPLHRPDVTTSQPAKLLLTAAAAAITAAAAELTRSNCPPEIPLLFFRLVSLVPLSILLI